MDGGGGEQTWGDVVTRRPAGSPGGTRRGIEERGTAGREVRQACHSQDTQHREFAAKLHHDNR